MKSLQWWSLLLLATCSYAASDECTTAKVLTRIRPGAAWSMQNDSIDRLKWLDQKHTKPSVGEINKGKRQCIADTKAREALKAQARLDLKNPTIPTDKKLEQLILLLDMDR